MEGGGRRWRRMEDRGGRRRRWKGGEGLREGGVSIIRLLYLYAQNCQRINVIKTCLISYYICEGAWEFLAGSRK